MLKRRLLQAGVLAVILGVVYVFVMRPDLIEAARGYPFAKSPDEAVRLFTKAVKERKYDMAAKYVTKDYADQLRKGAKAANELGTQVDDLVHRMEQSGVMTDELRLVLFFYDPFWKELSATVSNASEESATAQFVYEGVKFDRMQSKPLETWSVRTQAWRMLSSNWPLPPAKFPVALKKEGGQWKLDLAPKTTFGDLTLSVNYLIDKSKDYVNPFAELSLDIKNNPATKENVKGELKKLLESASRN